MRVNKLSQLNISAGNKFSKFVIPKAFKSLWVLSAITIVSGFDRNIAAMNPPINIPVTNIKFQASSFQLYWKKGILAGTQTAQICLKEDEMPKDLFPNNKSMGTVRPIIGPAIYHGQG
ncbi:hypothetical protein CQA01_14380 [Cyclobacterium qasimii]|uniref:Uncharacterized protein n=1 Tax=Cyclobacterium qasimii TaxID=1350429 RepID=A0A512C9N4_9BACT|nr:hypothetical protein CQA01_14380 [Cyclobacterium qasimii]